MPESPSPLEKLTAAVLQTAKYGQIYPALIERIGAVELGKGRSYKEALKATKSKLHQVGGAYQKKRLNYTAWLDELTQASQSGNPEAIQAACRQVMRQHTSTQERLPILDTFYKETLGELPPIHSVLDLACGFNPLTIPWMPLAPDVTYYACDIYTDLVGFLNHSIGLLGVDGHARLCDLIASPPTRTVDLALLLKAIPCLEQVDKDAGRHLLESIQARYLLVSFPVHSLGGRAKGMAQNYEAHFQRLIAGKPWQVTRFEFSTELAFLIQK